MELNVEKKPWWDYVHHDIRELISQSIFLVEMIDEWEGDPSDGVARSERVQFHDYSFVVFPAAKAYEGYLKTIFLDLGFITEQDFFGRRFRVGKALNPALDRDLRRREGVYDKIVAYCGGRRLAEYLWQTWKKCRNMLFHWFPSEKNVINFEEARERVERVVKAMDLVFSECKVEVKSNK